MCIVTDFIYEERRVTNDSYIQGEIDSRLISWNLCASWRISLSLY